MVSRSALTLRAFVLSPLVCTGGPCQLAGRSRPMLGSTADLLMAEQLCGADTTCQPGVAPASGVWQAPHGWAGTWMLACLQPMGAAQRHCSSLSSCMQRALVTHSTRTAATSTEHCMEKLRLCAKAPAGACTSGEAHQQDELAVLAAPGWGAQRLKTAQVPVQLPRGPPALATKRACPACSRCRPWMSLLPGLPHHRQRSWAGRASGQQAAHNRGQVASPGSEQACSGQLQTCRPLALLHAQATKVLRRRVLPHQELLADKRVRLGAGQG